MPCLVEIDPVVVEKMKCEKRTDRQVMDIRKISLGEHNKPINIINNLLIYINIIFFSISYTQSVHEL